jgi:hypothetical protein
VINYRAITLRQGEEKKMSTTPEMKLDEQWAVVEFADVELNDARLNRRCQELATALGQQPSAPINQACEDWADTTVALSY